MEVDRLSTDEIESLVKSGAEMPEDLNIAEICYFATLECLRVNKITRLKKSLLYQRAKASFLECQRWIAIYQNTCRMRVEVAKVARDMTVSSCPICKMAIAIFDGREIAYGNHACEYSDDGSGRN